MCTCTYNNYHAIDKTNANAIDKANLMHDKANAIDKAKANAIIEA